MSASQHVPKKTNRAKARLQKRADLMDAQRREAAAEAATMPDHRIEEAALIGKKLSSLGLVEHNIKADGHCLYAAVADQLASKRHADLSFTSMRKDAAQYVRMHPEEFEAFLCGHQTTDNQSVDAYADEIENTPRWGGEVEIIALARAHKVAVTIVQAQGDMLHFEDHNNEKIMLARYTHLYSLGAHFNSLRAI